MSLISDKARATLEPAKLDRVEEWCGKRKVAIVTVEELIRIIDVIDLARQWETVAKRQQKLISRLRRYIKRTTKILPTNLSVPDHRFGRGPG